MQLADGGPGRHRGGDHDRAVRQVEHAGHAEDQGEAGGAQRIERADGEAVDQDLPEQHALATAGRMTREERGRPARRRPQSRAQCAGSFTNAGNFGLARGELLRPHVLLLAVLPLQHQAGDVARAGAQAVHVRIALGQERDPADRADVVGLLHRVDQLVAVERAGAVHGLGDHVDLVVGGVARIGRHVAVLLRVGVDEGQRLGRDGHARARRRR